MISVRRYGQRWSGICSILPECWLFHSDQGRHCVTAFCGLRPLALQREVSPCEPLWPASQLFTRFARPSGQPAAVTPVGRFLFYQPQLSIRAQGETAGILPFTL